MCKLGKKEKEIYLINIKCNINKKQRLTEEINWKFLGNKKIFF